VKEKCGVRGDRLVAPRFMIKRKRGRGGGGERGITHLVLPAKRGGGGGKNGRGSISPTTTKKGGRKGV